MRLFRIVRKRKSRLELQRKSSDEVVSLIQGVSIDGGRPYSAEIECDAVVFVFAEYGQPRSQQKPCAAQGVEPEAGVGSSPEVHAGNPPPKNSGSNSDIWLNTLSRTP